MRIAISHTRFTSVGGIERYVHALVMRLLDAGHEVHVFVRRHEPCDHPRLFFHRVPALPLGEGLKTLSFAYASAVLLARQRFDAVHGFTKTFSQDVYSDGSGLAEPYLEFLRRVPLWRRISKYRPLMSYAYRHLEARRYGGTRPPRVLAISRMVREQILDRYPHLADRVEVAYNPIDVEEYHPGLGRQHRDATRRELETPDEATVFLFVGNDFRRKGLSTALRALVYLPPGAVLWVVGHDERRRDYEQYAAKLGVPVRFTGRHRDPRRFYAAADAFVFPSRYDTFGQVALEALACGLPVVASSAAGVSELIEGGESGYVQRYPDDPRELGRRMLELMDPETRCRMSEPARRTAEMHGWDEHMRHILRVYEWVRDEKRACRVAGLPPIPGNASRHGMTNDE